MNAEVSHPVVIFSAMTKGNRLRMQVYELMKAAGLKDTVAAWSLTGRVFHGRYSGYSIVLKTNMLTNFRLIYLRARPRSNHQRRQVRQIVTPVILPSEPRSTFKVSFGAICERA